MQPPEQKRLKVQIEQVETALAELRTVKDTLPDKLFAGGLGKPLALKAAFVATQNPSPIPLQLYAKSLGGNTWAIVDATNPSDSQIYQGPAGTGLQGAWETFSNQNNLPAGSVAANLPDIGKVFAQGQGGSSLKTWSSRTGFISIGLAAAGVGSLFVFPPAAPFLFGAAGASGAVSGGLNIADRVTYGNFRWQIDRNGTRRPEYCRRHCRHRRSGQTWYCSSHDNDGRGRHGTGQQGWKLHQDRPGR